MASIMSKKLVVVLLAAGSSSRLGQPKQLVKIHGESLLVHQCKMLLSQHCDVHCVLGSHKAQISPELASLPITIIDNNDWQRGLSSSIAAAIHSLRDNVSAALFVLVDQWQLNVNDITRLVCQWREQPDKIVTASQHSHIIDDHLVLGPPVIFPRRYFNELKQLTGPKGAKRVIEQYRHHCIEVEMPHAFIDLDTPEQLKAMENYFISD